MKRTKPAKQAVRHATRATLIEGGSGQHFILCTPDPQHPNLHRERKKRQAHHNKHSPSYKAKHLNAHLEKLLFVFAL